MMLPPTLVADTAALAALVEALAQSPRIAVDTESNSLHAYRERVCLIQLSTSTADYIVDPIALPDVSSLAPVFANPAQEKIFHAAEGDLIGLRRDFQFVFANIFDTMTGARTLGWPQVGLAAILQLHFGVTMNKKYQRADWRHRPLTAEQLEYARLDTHYLAALREMQFERLTAAGSWDEAKEEFDRVARPRPEAETAGRDVPAFWRVTGARDLTPPQAGILEALFAFREREAERLDRPPFKVMGEPTLMDIARRAPRTVDDLKAVPGLTPEQIRRYAAALLHAVESGAAAPPPRPVAATPEPDEVIDRYDRLHLWRKTRARVRGVESDVILPRTVLWDLARQPPRTREDLARMVDFGPWRRQTYGDELLKLLADPPPRQKDS